MTWAEAGVSPGPALVTTPCQALPARGSLGAICLQAPLAPRPPRVVFVGGREEAPGALVGPGASCGLAATARGGPGEGRPPGKEGPPGS